MGLASLDVYYAMEFMSTKKESSYILTDTARRSTRKSKSSTSSSGTIYFDVTDQASVFDLDYANIVSSEIWDSIIIYRLYCAYIWLTGIILCWFTGTPESVTGFWVSNFVVDIHRGLHMFMLGVL